MSDILGKVFAQADYREQAAMLSEAGKFLFKICDGKNYAEIQVSRISENLTREGKEFVAMLALFCEDAKS